jgi:hypothetical protein
LVYGTNFFDVVSVLFNGVEAFFYNDAGDGSGSSEANGSSPQTSSATPRSFGSYYPTIDVG